MFLCGASKCFMEARQRSVKIKIYVNFFSSSGGLGRDGLKRFSLKKIKLFGRAGRTFIFESDTGNALVYQLDTF